MAYDEGLAFRLRELLADRSDVREKAMFGGLAFLVGGNMSVGILGEELLVRVGAERHDAALARPHARVMDFTGRPMRGWIFVGAAGIERDEELAAWVAWGLETALTSAPTRGSRPTTAKRTAARARSPKPAPRKKARGQGR